MNANKFFLTTVAVALVLAGCGGQDTQAVDASTPDTGDQGGDGPVNTRPSDESAPTGGIQPWAGSTAAQVELVNNSLIVYFEFDRSEIRPEFNDMLAAHASYLGSDPALTIRLEGHSDERGSREYNIGLGERRARAVRQILLLQGASPSQVTTVSYGEERPAVFGSDEESYGLNRRVELIYR
jgi:peptidoglycan-associated lipoprotein